MKKKAELPVKLLPRETIWGFRYLLFELVFLGPLLALLLPIFLPSIESVHINTVYFGINFLAVALIFRQFLLHSLKHTLKHILKTVFATAMGLVIYLSLMKIVTKLTLDFQPSFQNINDVGIKLIRNANPLLTAIGTILLVPLAEEVLHRGLIFGVVHTRNRLLAYVISILAFCSIHVMGYVGLKPPMSILLSFIQYIPAGLILALLYGFTGSIFAPILMHTAVNILAFFNVSI